MELAFHVRKILGKKSLLKSLLRSWISFVNEKNLKFLSSSYSSRLNCINLFKKINILC